MRGLLVVNPAATTTTERVRDVLATALAADLTLETVITKSRGHAVELGGRARELGVDVVIVLGGDGTVNEIVNGILHDGPGTEGPALAVVPGGSTNVFARALGYPTSPVEATGELLAALRDGRSRTVSIGLAHYSGQSRWFTFCFGMGLDAEVVARVERRRERGRRSTSGLFLRSAAGRFAGRVGRSGPPIIVTTEGGLLLAGGGRGDDEETGAAPGAGAEPATDGQLRLGLAIVCNTRPWTYLNARPVSACPEASFDTGLDLLGLRRVRLSSVLRTGAQMLYRDARPQGRNVVLVHDAAALTLTAEAPLATQMDGEYLGDHTGVRLTNHAGAIRVIA